MKNKIITLIFIIIIIGISILVYITNSKDNNLTKVRVAEPTLTWWTVNVRRL